MAMNTGLPSVAAQGGCQVEIGAMVKQIDPSQIGTFSGRSCLKRWGNPAHLSNREPQRSANAN
jgi:hypothetical protein